MTSEIKKLTGMAAILVALTAAAAMAQEMGAAQYHAASKRKDRCFDPSPYS